MFKFQNNDERNRYKHLLFNPEMIISDKKTSTIEKKQRYEEIRKLREII